MRRGTSPTHVFHTSVETSRMDAVRIIYAQHGRKVLVKTETDCNFNDKSVEVTLTQNETLRFECGTPCMVQIRALLTDGKAVSSPIFEEPVEGTLDEEVMG